MDSASSLRIISDFFGQLNGGDVLYCHWKSNASLREAVMGETDLDLLVARDAVGEFKRVLAENGFKRFDAIPSLAYPAIEDYLGMAPESGALVHLHVHYQLILGERHLKGYRIPWESEVLSNRAFDDEMGIYVAHPDYEMLLLIVRASLKLRLRDWLPARCRRDDSLKRIGEEFGWLLERISEDGPAKIADRLLGQEAGARLRGITSSRSFPSLRSLAKFRRCMSSVLMICRTRSVLAGQCHRAFREYRFLLGSLNRKCLHLACATRRSRPYGGLMVAMLGCDGSGKSTLCKEISDWLSPKTDVVQVYFGSGDGPGSVLRWPLKLALFALRKLRGGSLSSRSRGGQDKASSQDRSAPLRAARALWGLILSREKLTKLCKAWRMRNRGIVAICDRYPQDQIMGFCDGPLLSHWQEHRSALLRRTASWERRPYQLAARFPPDLVIKLNVSARTAIARKADMDMQECERRVEAINALSYPHGTEVLEVDAERPVEEVLRTVQRLIWSRL